MHLFRCFITCATLAVLPLSVIVAETAKTTTTPVKKKSATKKKTATGTSTARRTTTTKKRTASSKNGVVTSRPPSRARQSQPTPERYKEIQQALATKGYLKSEPSGAWNQESVEALRRFQQDQNINASGKIDSLSLIALGLGPKRATAVMPPPPNTPAEPKPEAQLPAFN